MQCPIDQTELVMTERHSPDAVAGGSAAGSVHRLRAAEGAMDVDAPVAHLLVPAAVRVCRRAERRFAEPSRTHLRVL